MAVDGSSAITFVSGDVCPDISVDVTPSMTPGEATATVATDLKPPSDATLSTPELFVAVNNTSGDEASYHLVYRIETTAEDRPKRGCT